jgi:YVTN family beta-propeller protein
MPLRRLLTLLPVLLLTFLAAAPPAAAGTLLVANKAEATLSFVDTGSGEVVATVPTGTGPHEVAVSPDGGTAVVADYGAQTPGRTLTVVDVPGAKVLRTIDLGDLRRPHGVAFVDGTTLAVTTEAAKALTLVDVAKGEVLGHVSTGQEVSHMVALAGGRAWVANIGSGTATVIDLAERKKVADVATGAGAEGIAASPDGKQVWVANREADDVVLVDPKTLEIVARVASPDFPIRAEVTPDGRWLLVSNAESGDLSVIDAAARKLVRRVDLGQGASDVAGRLFGDRFGASSVPIGIEIAPDGKTAWIAHANADVVQVVDLTTWKPTGVLEVGKEPDGMGYSPLTVRGN